MRMFWRTCLALVGVLLLVGACDNSDDPADLPSGQVTLTDDEGGFSFEQGKIGTPSVSDVADVSVIVRRDENNNILGISLINPGLSESFSRLGAFDTPAAAADFFESVPKAPERGYQLFTTGLQAHQVWAVRTEAGKYAKILILSARLEDPTGIVTFAWVYQPDGTRMFDP